MVKKMKQWALDLGFVAVRIARDGGDCFVMLAMPYAEARLNRYFGLFCCRNNYRLAVDKAKILRAKVAELCRVKAKELEIFCNSQKLNEKTLAHNSGLGFYGKNSLLIVPNVGSLVVIVALKLPIQLKADPPLGKKWGCKNCLACQKACPTGALEKPYSVIRYRCMQQWASAGMDPPFIFKEKADIVYGCDKCQLACPYNTVAWQKYRTALNHRVEEWTNLDRWLTSTPKELEWLVKASPLKFSWLNKLCLQKNAKRIAFIESKHTKEPPY